MEHDIDPAEARPTAGEAGAAHVDEAGASGAPSDASSDATNPAPAADPETARKLALVLESLEDDKAEEVVVVDLAGKSSIADHMVIASGRSSRHVGAICEKLLERMKAAFGERPRAQGLEAGDWALIDASDIVVHVFRPEVRSYYALEKMWAPDAATPPQRRTN